MEDTLGWYETPDGGLCLILSRCRMPGGSLRGRDGDILLGPIPKEAFVDQEDALTIVKYLNEQLWKAEDNNR